jgi:hypothetical protein
LVYVGWQPSSARTESLSRPDVLVRVAGESGGPLNWDNALYGVGAVNIG